MVGPASIGDRSVEADVAQQMVIEPAQRFALMAARLRRGTDIEHYLAQQPAEAKKERPHAGKLRVRQLAKQ